MKAVLTRRAGHTVIDISHDVPRHDIRAGAFLLYSAAPNFPAGTVHLAVVDPGVGTARRPLIVASGGQFFVGPDNGLLIPAARRLGTYAVYEIIHPALIAADISSTFHGRDVFAPTAELLAGGTPVGVLALPMTGFVDLDFGVGRRINGALAGQVIYVDAFGNLVTNISNGLLDGTARAVRIQVGRRAAAGRVAGAYGGVVPKGVAVLRGSDGIIEIAVREGSAAKRFGASVGDGVRVRARVTPP